MLNIACYLVVGLGLGLDLVCGWLIAQCLLNSCVKIFKGSRWLEIFYVVSDIENQHLMYPEFDGTRVSCLED